MSLRGRFSPASRPPRATGPTPAARLRQRQPGADDSPQREAASHMPGVLADGEAKMILDRLEGEAGDVTRGSYDLDPRIPRKRQPKPSPAPTSTRSLTSTVSCGDCPTAPNRSANRSPAMPPFPAPPSGPDARPRPSSVSFSTGNSVGSDARSVSTATPRWTSAPRRVGNEVKAWALPFRLS